MIFNKHSDLEGLHAFLGGSKYHWINYDENKLVDTYLNYMAVRKGTELHALAKELIRLGVPLPDTDDTLNMYVNDAIKYKMTPEQVLKYSIYHFGTADALAFRNGFLRIHDLKTGVTPANMEQLEVYASIFCLEYKKDPAKIKTELRIYQSNKIFVNIPEPGRIRYIMGKATEFNKIIERLASEV